MARALHIHFDGHGTLDAYEGSRWVGVWRWVALNGAGLVVERQAESVEVELALARAALPHFLAASFSFVQLVVAGDAVAPAHLCDVGFQPLTVLEEWTRDIVPSAAVGGDIRPLADLADDEITKLIAATMEGTLDCPELNGCRTSQGHIAGLPEPGQLRQGGSFFTVEDGVPVGVILGECDKDSTSATLLYLGVIAAVRRKGVATLLLEHYFHEASLAGCSLVRTTVDERNHPAKHFYLGNQFWLCGSYRVWCWLVPVTE